MSADPLSVGWERAWVSPRAAYQAVLWDDAHLVDVRADLRRTTAGAVHPALRPELVGTDVLDDRLDPRGRDRLPWAAYDARVLVLGQEGDDAAPVAAALRRLGLWRATYVRGGFSAWAEVGMPITPPCWFTAGSAAGPTPGPTTGFHAGDVATAAS